MVIKTIAMISMYFLPYALIVTGLASVNLFLFYGLWILMGAGIAGIGTSVMHDSNHGAYSNNKTVNTLLGGLLNLLGGYDRNWRIQHNVLHHTYTNVDGLDEDIDAGILLRMSPNAKHIGMHRYQHLYAWLLYGIMNIYWVTAKDYKCLLKYGKNGMIKKEKISLARALAELSFYKLIYFGYILMLPMFFAGVAWYHVLLGFIVMHLVGGLLLACIFQLAHVMETSEYPNPVNGNKMESSWAVHQLLNTANFAPNNKLLSWYIGGLNFQIEHHLFPQICHVHYPKLSEIVSKVAAEYNVPYNVQPTFRKALKQHAMMLKQLGNPPKAA
ncbi:MAG: acyl-CoA desaturase [Chitinophagales bacterium]|nr:acyl-CoA desaturase [Chitinophagales bacterium]